jgi:small ligand-binding sensory domain FIST
MSEDHRLKLKFSVAVSRNNDAAEAGSQISGAVKRGLDSEPADLAFLFFSPHYIELADVLAAAVRAELAPRVLVGCTGEGVIAGSEEIESDAAVVLWAARLPDTPLSPIRLSFTQEEEGLAVSGWPDLQADDSGPPTFVLLAEPFSTPVDDVLSSLADRFPGSLAIGGLAGGGHDVGQSRILLNDEVYDSGLVGVAVSGPVSVRTLVSQGCRPIGERFVVTRAEKNVIHELGGSPALERLESVFKSLGNAERRMAHRALHVGIVMDEQRNRFERGDFLIRNLVGADRTSGSVAIGDLVREGQTVQFHIRDAGSASEDLNLLLTAERSKGARPTRGALLFSCCGRGRGLFGRPHHDVMTIRERMGDIPIAGFFAQGEIGPVGGCNFLHGYTASVALFSEPGS